jgi:hypothetical protein
MNRNPQLRNVAYGLWLFTGVLFSAVGCTNRAFNGVTAGVTTSSDAATQQGNGGTPSWDTGQGKDQGQGGGGGNGTTGDTGSLSCDDFTTLVPTVAEAKAVEELYTSGELPVNGEPIIVRDPVTMVNWLSLIDAPGWTPHTVPLSTCSAGTTSCPAPQYVDFACKARSPGRPSVNGTV